MKAPSAHHTAQACPHCAQALPRGLVWHTLFAGQVAHTCPHCGKRFRLTYPAKVRVGYLNIALVLGLTIVIGFAFLVTPGETALHLLVYLAFAGAILYLLPRQARYEKTSAPYRFPSRESP
jgi:uncharacterized protein (DUF983 family)